MEHDAHSRHEGTDAKRVQEGQDDLTHPEHHVTIDILSFLLRREDKNPGNGRERPPWRNPRGTSEGMVRLVEEIDTRGEHRSNVARSCRAGDDSHIMRRPVLEVAVWKTTVFQTPCLAAAMASPGG